MTTFIINRTSRYGSTSAPCPEAYPGESMNVDYRTFKTKADALKVDPKWFDVGSNHRRYPGGWCRDMRMEPCWYIDVPDLDALLELVGKHGRVIIGEDYETSTPPTIEIYDDYRE